ncbi:MAG: hypothetical protein AAF485_30180, partial [Chloroflexota bacterium]
MAPLVIFQNPAALLALPLLWILLILFAWPRRFKPFGPFLLRLAIIVLAVLALADPIRSESPLMDDQTETPFVFLVDQSASLGQGGQVTLRTEAARLASEASTSHTLYFADRPTLINQPDITTLPLDPDVSNIATALSMGASILDGQPGRLVLLSDGGMTTGDIDETVTTLAQQGIPVDVLLTELADRSRDELYLVDVVLPPVLREGETFNIDVVIQAVAGGEAQLTLEQDNERLANDTVQLEPGLNTFTFQAEASDIGPHTYKAQLTTDANELTINNQISGFTEVYPKPQILIVGETRLKTRYLNSQLRQAGFEVSWMSPANLPTRLSELEPFAGMVLQDVSARDFDLEQMIAIEEFVRSLGRGLVVTGGRDSFALGDYEETPLADLLPVTLEPPPREERPP